MADYNDFTVVSGDGYLLKLRIYPNISVSGDTVTYAPEIYRYDENYSDNDGGYFVEYLTVGGSAVSGSPWTISMEGKDGEGWHNNEPIDTFRSRTVTRNNSSQEIKLVLKLYEFATRTTPNEGPWAYAPNGYTITAFTYTVTPKTYTVSYNANGGSGSVSSQTKIGGQTLKLSSGSGLSRSYYTLDGWATSATGSVAYALGGNYTKNAALNLYAHWKINAPAAPTSASASRNSDAKATVTWVRGAGADTTYSRVYVERSTDGGTWTSLGYVAGTATSYADNSISANHSYRYRVRAYNSTAYSSYATSGYIYTTPAAPASVSGGRAQDGTSVILTVANSGTRNATGFDVQYRASSSGTWADATVASSTGTPVESITVSNMSGQFYFRVRNTRGTLASAWAESDLVVTITPPNAPTLVSPSSGSTIGATGTTKSVTFEWQHNPVDGSAQTAAELRYRRTTVQTWTTVSTTTAQSMAVTLNIGHSYVWQVRTKGADADFGPWSSVQGFDIQYPPTVAMTEPSSTVDAMPIGYSVDYIDGGFVFVEGTLTVKRNGAAVYSEPLPTVATDPESTSTITGEITSGEWIPDNGTYTFEFTVRSSSTLETTTTGTVEIELGGPWPGMIDTNNDPETGYCNVETGWRADSGTMEPTYATLYRVVGGERVLLADNLADGDYVLDRYAPLNTPYTYEIVTHDETGGVAVATFSNEIVTDRWFVYWGDNVAWAEWNPSGSYSITRPEKVRVHYVGREYPVSYDGTALDEAHNMTFTWWESRDGWMDNFSKLMHDGGRGIYKSVDGKVFRADFEVEISPEYTSITRIGTISLSIVRIDGDAL